MGPRDPEVAAVGAAYAADPLPVLPDPGIQDADGLESLDRDRRAATHTNGDTQIKRIAALGFADVPPRRLEPRGVLTRKDTTSQRASLCAPP
jgi:hypothetical protein